MSQTNQLVSSLLHNVDINSISPSKHMKWKLSEYDNFLNQLELTARGMAENIESIGAQCYSLETKISHQENELQAETIKYSQYEQQLHDLHEREKLCLSRREKARKTVNIMEYEFQRILAIYDDMKKQAEDIESLNADIVRPVLEKRKLEFDFAKEEARNAEMELQKSLDVQAEVEAQQKDLIRGIEEAEELLRDKCKMEQELKGKPQEIMKEINIIRKKIFHFQNEKQSSENEVKIEISKLDSEKGTLKKRIKDLVDLNKKIKEQEQLKTAIEFEYSSAIKALSVMKAQHESVITAGAQINIKLRDATEKARREESCRTMEKKQLDRMMRLYLKKKKIAENLNQAFTDLEKRLTACDRSIIEIDREHNEQQEAIESARDDVNIMVTRLLEQQSIEDDTRKELEVLIRDIDEKENDIDRLRTEVKKDSKIISLLENEKQNQMQKTRNILSDIKETEEIIRLKDHVISDVEKALLETNNSFKELKALYKSLDNKKNELKASLVAITRSVYKTREDIDKQMAQKQILQHSQEEKRIILEKEKDLHQGRKSNNATLRVDSSHTKESFRAKLGEDSRLEAQIEKTKYILSGLQRNSTQLRSQNLHLSNKIRIMSDQLVDRKAEMHSLLQRSNLLEETQKRGELALAQKEEDLRSLKIQCADIERHIRSKRMAQSDLKYYEEMIMSLKNELKHEINQQRTMSECLEDPDKNHRWKELGGHDLDAVQLSAKIKILEDRLDSHRAQIIERDVRLEELNSQIDQMNREISTSSVKTQPIMKRLNDSQRKMRDITRTMMSLVSELSMYQAHVLSLEDEKDNLNLAIEHSINMIHNGIPPSESDVRFIRHSNRESCKSASDESDSSERLPSQFRPNVYLIDDEKSMRPFGSMAPFKASSSSRFVKYEPSEKDISIEFLVVT